MCYLRNQPNFYLKLTLEMIGNHPKYTCIQNSTLIFVKRFDRMLSVGDTSFRLMISNHQVCLIVYFHFNGHALSVERSYTFTIIVQLTSGQMFQLPKDFSHVFFCFQSTFLFSISNVSFQYHIHLFLSQRFVSNGNASNKHGAVFQSSQSLSEVW